MIRPFSRKELPGLTFIFSLPEPATGMGDFRNESPCTLWKPKQSYIAGQSGGILFGPNGQPITALTYQKSELQVPFGELKNACRENARQVLGWGKPFELRLALPMGLDDPLQTFAEDIWRVGWVHIPTMTKAKEKRGLKARYGYYLLEKWVAGTPLRLDTKPKQSEASGFIGAERKFWRDRFKKA